MAKSTYKNATYPLRIDNTIAYKMKQIAKIENRSLNNMYETIARKYVEEYEIKHGVITIDTPRGGKLNYQTIKSRETQIFRIFKKWNGEGTRVVLKNHANNSIS